MAYTWTERTALGSLPWSATSARDTRMAAAVSYGGAGPEALLISQEVVNLENLGPYLVSGQSFTLSSGATISRISFNAAVATETTITANVRLLVGGAPSSIVATTSVIVAPGAFAWLDAVFTPQAVVAGEYLFEITAANNVYCMGAYGDPYAGGSFFYNGQPNPDRDMAFRVYVATTSGLLWKTIAVSDDGGEIIATYEDGSDSYNTKVKTSIDGGTTWVAHTSFTVHAPQVPCPVAISGNGSNIVFGSVGYPFMSGRDAALDIAPIPTEVTGTVTVPNTGGTITLTEDMSVTATGDLTLDVAEVGNLAGGKVITVQPGGKIKLTAGQQITVQAETLYELQT